MGENSGKSSAGLSRRKFLLGTASIATSAAMSGLPGRAAAQSAGGARTVLVLGAGMSGLTAALALMRRGHDVTIIEYQDRIGGRLLSLPLGDGVVTEAGGGHFRSNMPHVLNYVRRFGLPLLSMNEGLPRYMIDGKVANASDLSNWPWELSREERNVGISSNLNRYLFRVGLDTESVLYPDWPNPELMDRLSSITLSDLIQGVGASEAFCKILGAHGGAFTPFSQALAIIPDLAYHFGDQNLFRIRGGNNRLPLAMAGVIGLDRFVLGDPVAEIDQTVAEVRVSTRSGREFFADAVVSTIPFSVLDQVVVKPEWSAGKARMFAEMEWDKSVKVIVKTRTPSWLAKSVHGWPMAGGDRRWERFVDITGNEPGGFGSGFFYLNGVNSDAFLAAPKATRGQQVVDQFVEDMPDLFDQVLSVSDFAWTEQPWIRGSFGSPPINGAWMVREWERPEGRIHLAGDFTSLKTGWVEGAIESGLRAARQIDPEAPAEGSDR